MFPGTDASRVKAPGPALPAKGPEFEKARMILKVLASPELSSQVRVICCEDTAFPESCVGTLGADELNAPEPLEADELDDPVPPVVAA